VTADLADLAERRWDSRSLRRVQRSPPVPIVAVLGETIVHGEDIRRPVGTERDYPVTTLTTLADYYQGSDLPA
jgi:hypothetical protein